MRELLTVGDAAQVLECTAGAIRKMEERGALAPIGRTRGGIRLYDLDDVLRLKMARDARPTKWHPIGATVPEPYRHIDIGRAS